MHEVLVSELKDDLHSLVGKSDDEDYESEEKAHETLENNREIIDDKCNVEHMKRGYVGGRIKGQDVAEIMTEKLKSKEEEVNKMLKDKREEESEDDNYSSVSEWDSIDEDSEYEYGFSFDKLFDG